MTVISLITDVRRAIDGRMDGRGEKASRPNRNIHGTEQILFWQPSSEESTVERNPPSGLSLIAELQRNYAAWGFLEHVAIAGRKNNREHLCDSSILIETRTRARYNYESFASIAMESNGIEWRREMDKLKGFFLRGRNEDHAFAFRDVVIINCIILPRKAAEQATLPQSFASRPRFAIVT